MSENKELDLLFGDRHFCLVTLNEFYATPVSTTKSSNRMPQYEQLGRNLTNCFIRHKNRYQGGPERSRNGLRYRHTIADRILRTSEATGQLGIRESFKRANRKNRASLDYATRREENLRVPRARNIAIRICTP